MLASSNERSTNPSLAAPLVVVDRIVKRYGGKIILDHVSLHIDRGETLVVVGGSGAGKSTLIRQVVGLEQPDEGRILIGGVDLGTLSETGYDEPTTGLDPITSRKVDALIDETREKFLVTSLVITHDMATAYEIGDRVMLLDHGRFVAEGAVESFFASDVPAVRTFMDSSAIEPSKLTEKRRTRKSAAEIRAAWERAHPSSSPARS